MPIIGLTRRIDVEDQTHRLVYGTLRKGGPKPNDKQPGPDLDHWRFVSERPEVAAAFVAAYGDKPRVVDAYLPFPQMERNWITWREQYSHGGLLHRCDGQTMCRWRTSDGSFQEGEKPCPYFAGKERTKQDPGCVAVGRLYLIVPALLQAGYVGLVTLETHGKNDCLAITTSLIDIESKARGNLSGILLSVMRVQQTISTPAWSEDDKKAGKRNRTAKWLVKIAPAADWVMAQLEVQAERQMVLAGGKPLQLTSRPVQDPDAFDEDDDDLDLPEFTDPDLPDEQPEDVEDAEFEAIPSATEEHSNTPAAKIIARLRDLGSNDSRPLDETTSKKLWGNLSSLTARNAARGKELLRKVFNVDHSDKLTLGQASALAEWIHASPVKENGKIVAWIPSDQALAEYKILFPPDPELLPK